MNSTTKQAELYTASRVMFTQSRNCKPTHCYCIMLMSINAIYVHPMSDVQHPMSGVTHGFRSFKGKVLELLSSNLVCRLIGSVACLGLLLAVVPHLLTE